MKKAILIFLTLAISLISLTSCGTGSFDGKWECTEARVATYGNDALHKGYTGLSDAGCLSLLCELKIDGNNVNYTENMLNYTVSNVRRSANSMSFNITDNRGISSYVMLSLADNGKSIILSRSMNTYTLERADFIHKIILKIPVWIYIFAGVFAAFILAGRIVKEKDKLEHKYY